jgi:hypothetical protein
MNDRDAVEFIHGLKEDASIYTSNKGIQHVCGGKWKDPLHVATDCFRAGLKLSRDENIGIVCAELFLNRALPHIEEFAGIFEVDSAGIWYYDGDGHIDDAIWKQYLIPWHAIDAIVLHQVS